MFIYLDIMYYLPKLFLFLFIKYDLDSYLKFQIIQN